MGKWLDVNSLFRKDMLEKIKRLIKAKQACSRDYFRASGFTHLGAGSEVSVRSLSTIKFCPTVRPLASVVNINSYIKI